VLVLLYMGYYLGSIDTNYIIFSNVKMLKSINQIIEICEWNNMESWRNFFFEVKISKLIHSFIDMCQSCHGIKVISFIFGI